MIRSSRFGRERGGGGIMGPSRAGPGEVGGKCRCDGGGQSCACNLMRAWRRQIAIEASYVACKRGALPLDSCSEAAPDPFEDRRLSVSGAPDTSALFGVRQLQGLLHHKLAGGTFLARQSTLPLLHLELPAGDRPRRADVACGHMVIPMARSYHAC